MPCQQHAACCAAARTNTAGPTVTHISAVQTYLQVCTCKINTTHVTYTSYMHVYAHLCIPSLIYAWQYTVQMQCKLLATSASGWNRTSSSCLCSCAPLHHTSTIAVICYATKSATISTSAICPKHCAMQQRNIAIGAACQYANTAGACPTSDTYRPEVGVSQQSPPRSTCLRTASWRIGADSPRNFCGATSARNTPTATQQHGKLPTDQTCMSR